MVEKNRKKVCIIHTGGTIGMARTAKGYAPQAGFVKSTLSEIRELNAAEMPKFDLIEYSPLLDSSSISVKEWVKLAKDIEKKYNKYDGFIILHGTDTMAYTASALSFMLEELTKPVILTGSQIPLCEIRNDARDNLITALLIAGNYQIPEVCIYFESRLMRGNRAKKVSTNQLIAFDSPNFPSLADAGVKIVLNDKNIRDPGTGIQMFPIQEHPIAVIRLFPGIQFQLIEKMISSKIKAIVIEAFGSGNIPGKNAAFLKLLKKAQEKGTLILVCTQCLRGAASLGEYEASQELVKAGAVSGLDMTVEAAVTKLFYLFSKGYNMEMIKKLMETNLRGELTEHS
ncbi:asparaginase [Clostridiales bacterium BAD-6]|uniref:asparaginase n=2 Tax=Sinanaerobacter chloroacetimidivorans TaxID=2818044 RepID=A0A8J8B2S1_9FIRM|nr:asparaginase [Sinanaerobacter chloroacetimidivorans]